MLQPAYGLVGFVEKSFNVTLRPVFGYRVEIPIKNFGSSRICVWLSVENPYTDIRVGFVGLGVTEPLCLNPGEVKYATLIIYAQNAKRSVYTGIRLLILNINRTKILSTASLTLIIKFPVFKIKFNIINVNPYTLAKTITITNLGGPITGLTITVIGNAYIRPQIRDYYLPHGASLTFTVIPVLYEGFTQESVIIVISAFNGKIVRRYTITFSVPPGKHVYGVTLRNVEYIVTLKNYECLNVKHIVLNFTLPRLITETNVKYVYLIMQFVVHWSSWPFTTTISINGIDVGKVPNQIPSGYYIFNISKNVFRYGGRENIFEIYSDGMNPGDYITTGRIKIIFYISSVRIYVVASSISEAHKAAMMIARSLGIIYAGADVAVFKNAISISGELVCGKTVKLMIRVYNLGTQSTGRVRLVVYSGSMILATAYLSNIAPASYATATLTITIPSNAYTIRIVVYSAYDIRTWDNTVELAVKHVGVALPDLAVSDLTITPPRPTINSTVIASYEICNYGNKNAYNVEYIVELDGKVIQDVTIPQVSSYQCTYYYTVLGKLSEGWHTVTVIVDPHNRIRESNENNNRMQVRFYVSPIMPTCRIEITSRSIVVGEIASIRIWLVNCPIAASLDLELRFNPHIINVINITPGPFKEAINDVFVTNINNTEGILAIAIAGTSPCNEYRILVANVTIKGIHIGETKFTPIKAVVSDIEGRLHKVAVTGGIVRVVKLIECDFNHNGKLDVGDVVLLLKILLGTYHSNVPCDLNHNGRLDIGDAVLLLKKILKTLT